MGFTTTKSGTQTIKVIFKAEEDTADAIYHALSNHFGKFDYDREEDEYTFTKEFSILIEKFSGDEIDSPYTDYCKGIDTREIEDLVDDWYDEIDDLRVREEISEDEE